MKKKTEAISELKSEEQENFSTEKSERKIDDPYSVIEFLEDKGYRRFKDGKSSFFGKITNNIIIEVERADMVEEIRNSLLNNDNKLRLSNRKRIRDVHKNARKTFDITSLEFIKTELIQRIRDTEHESYFFYLNTAVRVTKNVIEPINYADLKGHVFEDEVLQRNFYPSEKVSLSSPELFLYHIAGQDDFRFLSLKTAMGYLLHKIQNPTTTKAVFFLDSNINELGVVNGGTGKSLILLFLSYMRVLCQISGKDFSSNNRFVYDRMTQFTSIVGFNDMNAGIDFEHFFGRSTDGQLIERKFKQSVYIPYIYSPKLAFTSNYYPKSPSGNSTDRRLYVYEVSTYYSKNLTPKDEFGHSFFYDWNEEQWLEFDRLMISCVQLYLQHGLLVAPSIHLEQRKLISEVGTEMMEFLDEVLLTKTKLHKKELFAEFRRESTASSRYQLSRRGFTIKLKKYLEYKEIPYRETPSDTKVFIEIINKETEEKQNLLTINDIKTDYKTVDTANKMTRLVNHLQKFFSTDTNPEN